MSINFAVLLDGGFVRHKLSAPRAPVDAAAIHDFAAQIIAMPLLSGMRLHRIYFYDARPLEAVSQVPLSGGAIDFSISFQP